MLKTKLKKRISLLLSAVLICTSFGIGILSYGNDLIAINADNFSDAVFRRCVSYLYDSNNDGFLSAEEISAAKTIKISGVLEEIYGENTTQQISSLKGIEFFTSCERLRCGGIGLTELDVSALTNMVELTCPGNYLSTLDLTKNTKLQILNCSSNSITELNVTNNTALTRIDCYINQLKTLDVSKNTALEILRCQQNDLGQIDLSKNTALTTLNCSMNHLLSINLSANTNLTDVTDSNIGQQTTSAYASISNGKIYVNLVIPSPNNVTSTSVDRIVTTEDGDTYVSGYVGYNFEPESIDDIVDGITYYYNSGLDGAEYMSVHVDVIRNFSQVKFYTDDSKTELIKTQVVLNGLSATLPDTPEAPQCKIFNGWSDTVANIQEDKEIYAKWKNAHSMKLVSFENKVAEFDCEACLSNPESYNFALMVNVRQGSKRYASRMDINSDGIINGKDYAMLLQLSKNKQ